VTVIGKPIPACESELVSREAQAENMAAFLGGLAQDMNLPPERVVCVGMTRPKPERASARANGPGMKLLTKEILNPSYAVPQPKGPWRPRQGRSGLKVFTTFGDLVDATQTLGKREAQTR